MLEDAMRYFIVSIAISLSCLLSAEDPWVSLFDGESLKGWETIIQGEENGTNLGGHVTAHDGVIHMYENVPEGEIEVPFGVIMTKNSYSQFHLTFQYRWIGKRFHPRKEKLRDAGLLYHCFGEKKVWPNSIECQVQEGDTGDLVFLSSGALTWNHPAPKDAALGQGGPGLLPEHGGVLRRYRKGGYIGRFPENDHKTGWNTVEAIVHNGEYSYHKVNDIVTSRVLDMRKPDGTPLVAGPIALQLEAAEIQYREIKIRELDGYLRPSQVHMSLSKIEKLKGQSQIITISNTSKKALPVAPTYIGNGTNPLHIVSESVEALAPGESREFEISLSPTLGHGNWHAGIQFGDDVTGCFVQVSGLVTEGLEEENEPMTHQVVYAQSAKVDVKGNDYLFMTEKSRTESSLKASGFSVVAGETLKVTPLARYSHPGDLPYGIYDTKEGTKTELAQLSNTSDDYPDAHQCLMPPSSEAKYPEHYPKHFGIYLKGPDFTSYTEEGKSEQAKHRARIYPVTTFQGRRVKNAYLVSFEETRDSKFQDVLLLVEGVVAK